MTGGAATGRASGQGVQLRLRSPKFKRRFDLVSQSAKAPQIFKPDLPAHGWPVRLTFILAVFRLPRVRSVTLPIGVLCAP